MKAFGRNGLNTHTCHSHTIAQTHTHTHTHSQTRKHKQTHKHTHKTAVTFLRQLCQLVNVFWGGGRIQGGNCKFVKVNWRHKEARTDILQPPKGWAIWACGSAVWVNKLLPGQSRYIKIRHSSKSVRCFKIRGKITHLLLGQAYRNNLTHRGQIQSKENAVLGFFS